MTVVLAAIAALLALAVVLLGVRCYQLSQERDQYGRQAYDAARGLRLTRRELIEAKTALADYRSSSEQTIADFLTSNSDGEQP